MSYFVCGLLNDAMTLANEYLSFYIYNFNYFQIISLFNSDEDLNNYAFVLYHMFIPDNI